MFEGRLEGVGVKVEVADTPAGQEDQASGDDILDEGACVRAGHPHQELDVAGEKGNGERHQQHQQREEQSVEKGAIATPPAVLVKSQDVLEVVTQGDADDGEAGGDGEDRKEGEKVLDVDGRGYDVTAGNGVTLDGLKVEGVKVVEV